MGWIQTFSWRPLEAGSLEVTPDLAKDQDKWAEKAKELMAGQDRLTALTEQVAAVKTATKIAFIQCVGSRDLRFYPFCSGYCCMHAIKEAIIAHEHDNDTESVIFGMDIRAVGKGFEEYKIRGGNASQITYRRSRVAEIVRGENQAPVLIYEDTTTRKIVKESFDLVVLSTACAPVKGAAGVADTLGVALDKFGFFKTEPSAPLDTTKSGVFVCGCAHSPMDIPESVAQASSAAARAVQTVMKSKKAS